MSQSKAQLTNPLGPVNLSGLSATGVVTATTFIGDGTNLTGIALTGNINTTGIITASAFYGSGANLSGAGLGPTSNINTSGIITAGKFYGDGSLLTNIGGAFTPLTYSPGIGETNVGISSNIVITFNKPIKIGTGTITLRTGSASGTIVESYDVTTSSRISINAGVLTIDPTNDFVGLTTYYVVLPAGTIKDTYNLDSNTLIDTYSFTTQISNLLFMWGNNIYGELGQNNVTYYSSPVQIPGTQWSSFSAKYGTLATKTDGTLWSWGYGQQGQLGQNNITPRSSPVQVPGTQWNKINAEGYIDSLATKTDGTLWAWGYNVYGALGLNDRANRSSPQQIPGTQWNNISGDVYIHLATKTDGTLWSWGYCYNGELGLNESLRFRSSPTQIPGTQWSSVSAGNACVLATKTDGTLWGWGSNGQGRLGQNNITQFSSPIQIPGTQWNRVTTTSGGGTQGAATKTDGTLWVWGYNVYGTLGQNDIVSRSSPIQVPGTQWNLIEGGNNLLLATKTDGTLWAWGYGREGALGINQPPTTNYSSPVQIPGTQWNFVNAGGTYISGGIRS